MAAMSETFPIDLNKALLKDSLPGSFTLRFLFISLVFAVLVAITRWVSLGSMVAAALFPITCWFIWRNVMVTVLAAIAGVLIVVRHKDNAKRIALGEENKFELKKE